MSSGRRCFGVLDRRRDSRTYDARTFLSGLGPEWDSGFQVRYIIRASFVLEQDVNFCLLSVDGPSEPLFQDAVFPETNFPSSLGP